jgi:hypothetical protein
MTPTPVPVSAPIDTPPCGAGYQPIQNSASAGGGLYCRSIPGYFPSGGGLSCDGIFPSGMPGCQSAVAGWNAGSQRQMIAWGIAGAVILLAPGWMKALAVIPAYYGAIQSTSIYEGF